MDNNNDYNLLYTEVLEEEGLKVSDLPIEIKKKIRGLVPNLNNLKNNPDNEKIATSVKEQDIRIQQSILNWLEEDLPQETDEERAIRKFLLEHNNQISENMLKKMLGRSPKSKEEVGGIVLKRPFLSGTFRVV